MGFQALIKLSNHTVLPVKVLQTKILIQRRKFVGDIQISHGEDERNTSLKCGKHPRWPIFPTNYLTDCICEVRQ